MLLRFMLAIAALIVLAVATTDRAEAREPAYLAPPGSPARVFPPPQRPVADIVSPTRSTEQKRDAAGEFDAVARILRLKSGMTVGDIGAGSGYYATRLSPLVGPSGLVIAQDVKRSYLAQLAARLDRSKLANVKLALGHAHDPRLPPRSLDAAILAHVYHEVAQPYGFLYNLAPALKSGAQLAIIDLDKPVGHHGTPPALLRCELAAVGYREVSFHVLPADSGYLAVFEAPDVATLPSPSTIEDCRT